MYEIQNQEFWLHAPVQRFRKKAALEIFGHSLDVKLSIPSISLLCVPGILCIFLVMMRVNSWAILLILLTVLSCFPSPHTPLFPPDSAWLTLSGYCLTCQPTLPQLPAVLPFHAMGLFFALNSSMVLHLQRANLFPQQPVK